MKGVTQEKSGENVFIAGWGNSKTKNWYVEGFRRRVNDSVDIYEKSDWVRFTWVQ